VDALLIERMAREIAQVPAFNESISTVIFFIRGTPVTGGCAAKSAGAWAKPGLIRSTPPLTPGSA
jgi:hypothetical protein